MKPKLSDIARNLSVSSTTVSLALSGKGRIAEKTAERIRAEAARLSYAPNYLGKALRTGRSGVIGLVLPDVANPLFPRMAQAIALAAEAEGLGTLIADSHNNAETQADALKRLAQLGADGVVVIPRKGTKIEALDIPVVVIDAPGSPFNIVSADHEQGGALAATHLLAQGHRSFIFAGDTRSSLVQRTRIKGMLEALPGDVTVSELWLEDSPDIVAELRKGATAIATTSDMIALQLLTELGRAGISVPQDVSIIGFDALDFGPVISPPLTTIGSSMAQIAEKAVAGLSRIIDGETAPENVAVAMYLIERNTVCPPSQLNRSLHETV